MSLGVFLGSTTDLALVVEKHLEGLDKGTQRGLLTSLGSGIFSLGRRKEKVYQFPNESKSAVKRKRRAGS